MIIRSRDQVIPIECSKQRPCRDRKNFRPCCTCIFRSLPNVPEPSQLFLSGAAIVALGDSDRQTVAIPSLQQKFAWFSRALLPHSCRDHIGVCFSSIPAVCIHGITFNVFVEKPLTT